MAALRFIIGKQLEKLMQAMACQLNGKSSSSYFNLARSLYTSRFDLQKFFKISSHYDGIFWLQHWLADLRTNVNLNVTNN